METFLAAWDEDIEKSSTDKAALRSSLIAKLVDEPNSVEIYWRLVKVSIYLALGFEKRNQKVEAKKCIEESLAYAKKALEVGANSMRAHLWYCAAVGQMAPHVSIKERIKFGYEFQEHRNIANKLDPNDTFLHHMHGRWCYEVASLSFIERKLAETFIAKPPVSSYEECLQSLEKSHHLTPYWKTNQLWIAKTYLAMRKPADAIKWIDSALGLTVKSEDDAVAQKELVTLERSYAKYRN